MAGTDDARPSGRQLARDRVGAREVEHLQLAVAHRLHDLRRVALDHHCAQVEVAAHEQPELLGDRASIP